MLKLSNYLDLNTYLTLICLYLERNIHMNVRYLTYFVEVAKEKNFTRAANNLHLSQPALSKVIKNLEIDLGISLIDRTAKNFKLTDQGEIFFTNAQNALENINSEFEQLYCSIDSTKGKLVVGIPPVIGTVYFASMIAKFKSKYPDIEFTMIEAGANNVKSKVNDSEVDIGVVILPAEDEGLNVIEIINSEIVLVINKEHKLAQKDNIYLKQLYCSIDSTKGKLVVGIPPVIGTVYFASMIAKFKSKYPDIEFTMIEAGANNVKSKVNDSEVDIGVVILPAEDKDLNVIEIINSEIVLVINKEHKLAQKDNIYLKDLNSEGFITLNENYMIYDKLNLLFEDGGFDPNITYKSSQWDFVAEMVALNQGIAILPKPIFKSRYSNTSKANCKEI